MAIVLWICAGVSPTAQGQGVSFSFTATVSDLRDLHGLLGGKIQKGDILTGTMTYASNAVSRSQKVHYAAYEFTSGASISVSGGGVTFAADPNSTHIRIEVVHGGTTSTAAHGDTIVVRSYNNVPLNTQTTVDMISWQLEDAKGKSLSGQNLPAGTLALSSWKSFADVTIHGLVPPDTGQEFYIKAHLTQLTTAHAGGGN